MLTSERIAPSDDLLQQACDQACAALAQGPVEVTQDDRGRRAFGLCLDGIDLSVVHLPGEPADTLHALADVAPPLPGRPWGPLLEINAWLVPLSDATLCRHPATGGVLLRARLNWPGCGGRFIDEIRRLADMARQLRQVCGMPQGAAVEGMAA